MLPYAAKRIAWSALLCLVLTFTTYVIFFVMPTPSFRGARGRSGTLADFRQAADLHGSFLGQYVQFVRRLVTHGALGTSPFSRRSVNDILLDALPVTLSLLVGGAVVWLLFGVGIGVVSALRPRSTLDRGGMVVVLFGISAHPLWIGLVLSYVFGFKLGWFPIGGYCDMFGPSTGCGGPVQWAYHLILPWTAFALLFSAIYARLVRAVVAETLHDDFVRTARAKGAGELTVVWQILRVACMPLVAALAADLGTLALGATGSALFVERAFGLPGLGRLSSDALLRKDFPVIVGVVVLVSLFAVAANLVADLAHAVLDPRVPRRAGPL